MLFRLADQTSTNANDIAVTPAKQVTADYTWNLANADLPSGTIITYWWLVEDKAGNKAESERKNFTYEDTRFTWKRLNREDVTLNWYNGGDALGRDLLDAAVTAYQQLSAEFSVERKPASIYIYGSFEDLRSGIGQSAQEWTGGRAYPEFNVVLIGVPPSELSFGKRAVPHEFSHLIINRATANPYGDLPRWLDEGLAMWAEGDLDSAVQECAQPGHQEQATCLAQDPVQQLSRRQQAGHARLCRELQRRRLHPRHAGPAKDRPTCSRSSRRAAPTTPPCKARWA